MSSTESRYFHLLLGHVHLMAWLSPDDNLDLSCSVRSINSQVKWYMSGSCSDCLNGDATFGCHASVVWLLALTTFWTIAGRGGATRGPFPWIFATHDVSLGLMLPMMIFNINSLLLQLVTLGLNDISLLQNVLPEIRCRITKELLYHAFSLVDLRVKGLDFSRDFIFGFL